MEDGTGTETHTHQADADEAPTTQLQEPQTMSSANIFDSLFSIPTDWDHTQQMDLAVHSPQLADPAESVLVDYHADHPGSPESIQFESHSLQHHSTEISSALANHSMELIFRVLRTWPKMLAEEFQIPPLFHPNQITPDKKLPQPLANCITLTKMWHGQRDGTEEMVRKTIMRELDSIADQVGRSVFLRLLFILDLIDNRIQNQPDQLDGAALIAVLQAIVIYAIILISPTANAQGPRADHSEVFRRIELLVYHVVRTGLFLPEEREQTRPSWTAWVHVTSKRRAVLALYLLHWAYSVLYQVPCFDCRDLGFMPAPTAKVLWQAQTEQTWKKSYLQWLARWNGQLYLQGEIGNIRPGVVMDARAERWLQEVDEFGFIFISIGMFCVLLGLFDFDEGLNWADGLEVNATDFDPPALKVLV